NLGDLLRGREARYERLERDRLFVLAFPARNLGRKLEHRWRLVFPLLVQELAVANQDEVADSRRAIEEELQVALVVLVDVVVLDVRRRLAELGLEPERAVLVEDLLDDVLVGPLEKRTRALAAGEAMHRVVAAQHGVGAGWAAIGRDRLDPG